MEANEVHEMHEHAEHVHEDKGLLPVSLSMAILAVLVALVTMLGHRSHTEEVLLQGKVTDQWSYYQAKNTQNALAEQSLATLSFIAQGDKGEAAKKKLEAKVEKYAEKLPELEKEARALEAERDLTEKRATFYDIAETLLEAALVATSITLLTRQRFYWFSGIALAIVGAVVSVYGLLLHA